MIVWIVSSSLLILLVLLLRAALKDRVSPCLGYALWLLVLLRLLFPGTLAHSPVSVQNVLPAEVVSAPLLSPAVPIQGAAPSLSEPPDAAEADLMPRGVERHAHGFRIDPRDLLFWIWQGGIAVLLLTVSVSELRFSLRLRRSRQIRQDSGSRLPVYTVSWLSVPCLAGPFSPAIYLPEGLDGEALRHVLAHEETHKRHGDLIWARLRLLALALHWYNPLVWIAALLSKRDAELACDEGALRRLGERERVAYGETLLRLSEAKFGRLLTLSTAMADSRQSLTERIRFIARRPRTRVTALLAVLLLLGLSALSSFTGALTASPERYTEQLESTDGTVKAVLDFPNEEDLFPDGAPIIQLTPHEISADEMHRIVSALFGESTPVRQDQEENLYLQDQPLATQETLDRWLGFARELRESDFLEQVSAGEANVLRHRQEELEDFLSYYSDPAFYSSMPREAELLPMVWDGSVRQCLAEKDGISYRITCTPRMTPDPVLYTLSITPEDSRPAALYAYVLQRFFGGQTASEAQLAAARERTEALVQKMGLRDWELVEVRPVAFPFPGDPESSMIEVVLDRRYDPRMPIQQPTAILSYENTLRLELAADGRLVDLHWSWPLDAAESREADRLLSWPEILDAVRRYVTQSSAEDYGFVCYVGEEGQRMVYGAEAQLHLVSLRPGLSYARQEGDPQGWQLIPSIAVYGDVELRDESGAPLSLEGAAFGSLHDPSRPLLLLSALDGSLLEDGNTPPAFD